MFRPKIAAVHSSKFTPDRKKQIRQTSEMFAASHSKSETAAACNQCNCGDLHSKHLSGPLRLTWSMSTINVGPLGMTSKFIVRSPTRCNSYSMSTVHLRLNSKSVTTELKFESNSNTNSIFFLIFTLYFDIFCGRFSFISLPTRLDRSNRSRLIATLHNMAKGGEGWRRVTTVATPWQCRPTKWRLPCC